MGFSVIFFFLLVSDGEALSEISEVPVNTDEVTGS